MPEREINPDEVSQLIFTDDLTGLYNRRFLYSYLTRRVAWQDPNAPPLSLALIDIDHFKALNDTHGHLEGDQLIRNVASLMRQAFRPEDLVVRYGGDELCALMVGVGKEEAAGRCEALRTRVASQPLLGRAGRLHAITLSLGLAAAPQDARDGEALIDAADQALYYSKRGGRNRTSLAGALDEAVVAERDPFVGLPCPVFLGRDSEAERIRTWIRDLRRRTNRFILLRGPSGIGKSRLLREITRWASEDGILYLLARCSEQHMFTAYHAVAALIENTLAHQTDTALRLVRRLSPQEMFALRDLVPALRRFPAPEIEALGDKEKRRAIFEGLVGLLFDISDRDPIVLLLDQLEYADRGTLEVLHWLLRPGSSRIILAATLARDPSPGSPLHELLPAFQKETRLESVEMGPLPAPLLHRMLDAILPDAEHDSSSYERIVSTAGGNPLYIEETVRSLILRDKIVRSGRSWKVHPLESGDLPESLDRVIQQVLSTIQPEANEILTNASIIGGQFDLQLLKEVMGQNEGRTQDALDRAEAVKLIYRGDPDRPDEFHFTNDRTRQVGYQSTPEEARMQMHLRVGEAEERLERIDPSELAWHYDRAGDHERAERFRQERTRQSSGLFRAEEVQEFLKRRPGAREPRVSEASRPLPPEATPKAEAFLRHLAGAVRMVRLYPEYSTLSENFGRQLRKATEELLAWAPVTFAARGTALQVNGADAGPIGVDLAGLLNERLIASFTLGSAASWPEMDALAHALMEPFDRSAAPPDHWDHFLDDKGIRNLDVVQRVYVDNGETSRRLRRDPEAERPLEPAEIPLVRDALRSLKAAVDNRRLYPAGHSLVEQSKTESVEKIRSALEGPGLLTLATAEGSLLLNGVPADPRTFSDAGEFFARLLDRHKLRSLSLMRGIVTTEVQTLIEGLCVPPEEAEKLGTWSALQMIHVRVGDRAYALRAAGIDATAPTPAGEDPVARAKAYVEAPPGELLTDRFRADFPSLVNALVGGPNEAVAKTLVERLLWLFRHEEPGARSHAAATLSDSFRSLSDSASRFVAGHVATPLVESLTLEGEIKSFEAMAASVAPTTRLLLAARQPRRVLEILECLLAITGTTKPAADSLLRRLGSEGALQPVRDWLRGDDPGTALTAVRILASTGPEAAEEIAEALISREAVELRLAFAESLRSLGPRGAESILRRIDPSSSKESCIRSLQVLDAVVPEIPEEDVVRVLGHPEGSVRQEVVRLLRRVAKGAAERIVRRVFEGNDAEAALLLLTFATEMRMAEVADQVLRYLREEKNERVLRGACHYFEAVPTPEAVPALGGIVNRRPKLFGLVRGLSEETRAAAARALGAHHVPEAEAWIRAALSDKSAAVRSAVKLGQRPAK